MAEKNDLSYLACYFAIELDGIQAAKFSKCEGLEAETYIYEVEEGGLNTNTYKFYGRTRYPNIILENGISNNKDLWNWYKNTVLSDKKIERKSGAIIMYDSANKEVKRWDFVRAIPCRWVGPQLSIEAGGIAIEKLEIAHEGFDLK
jgi:phage tail-like protein